MRLKTVSELPYGLAARMRESETGILAIASKNPVTRILVKACNLYLFLRLSGLEKIHTHFWHELYFNAENPLGVGPKPPKHRIGSHHASGYRGAGLLILPPDVETYLAGRSMRALRNNLNRLPKEYILTECTNELEPTTLTDVFSEIDPNLECHFTWRRNDPSCRAFKLCSPQGETLAMTLLRQDGKDWFAVFSVSRLKDETRWVNHFLLVKTLISLGGERLVVSSIVNTTSGLQHFARLLGFVPVNLVCRRQPISQ